jgi:hypothetical protein
MLFAFGTVTSGPSEPQGTIFRQIHVDNGKVLTLGEPVPDNIMPDLVPDGANRWSFREGTFGDAQSITVHLAPNGDVRTITFTYEAGTDYATSVQNFTAELGRPSSTGGSGSTEWTRWQDKSTRFTLESDDGAVSSILHDRLGGGDD